jgi:hypothetical protein
MFAYLTVAGAAAGWLACRTGGAAPPQATTIKARPDATPSRVTSDLKITKPPPPPANPMLRRHSLPTRASNQHLRWVRRCPHGNQSPSRARPRGGLVFYAAREVREIFFSQIIDVSWGLRG